ncbi:unnamed protein product, partial [Rotaria socialis]
YDKADTHPLASHFEELEPLRKHDGHIKE